MGNYPKITLFQVKYNNIYIYTVYNLIAQINGGIFQQTMFDYHWTAPWNYFKWSFTSLGVFIAKWWIFNCHMDGYLSVRFLKMALVHWIIRGVSIHALSSDPKIILGSMQFTGDISIHPMFYPHVPYSFFGFRRLESCDNPPFWPIPSLLRLVNPSNQIPHQGPWKWTDPRIHCGRWGHSTFPPAYEDEFL